MAEKECLNYVKIPTMKLVGTGLTTKQSANWLACTFWKSTLENQATTLPMPPLQVGFYIQEEEVLPRMRTLLLIGSDIVCDVDLRVLKCFWMWDPLKEKWIFVRDWEEHKQEAGRKFEEYVNSRRVAAGETGEMRRPLKKWVQ